MCRRTRRPRRAKARSRREARSSRPLRSRGLNWAGRWVTSCGGPSAARGWWRPWPSRPRAPSAARSAVKFSAMDPRAVSGLADELFDRLEEVHVQAGQLVDAGELRIGGPGGEAIIADEVAHHGPVLLLDVRTVVFLPGPAAGEGNALALAPCVEAVVDELRAVVTVEANQGHRPALAHPMHGRAHSLLALAPDGFE